MRSIFFHIKQVMAILACVIHGNGMFVVSFDGTVYSRRKATIQYIQKHQFNDMVRRSSLPSRICDDVYENENENVSLTRNQRRCILRSIFYIPVAAAIPTGRSSMEAKAAMDGEEKTAKKPFAPIDNLLPAVRVKVSIDVAIGLTKSLLPVTEGDSKNEMPSTATDTIARLEELLLKPKNYVQSELSLQGVPSKPANLYLKSYQSTKGDLPFQKALVQSGDIDAWKRLKRREKALEKSSSIRTALNAYTDALSFSGDSYLLKVDPQTRSSMVREDRLPDIKQVITSDMGLRYLYRNQVLTAMDDVKAEFEFQLNQSQGKEGGGFDGRDLLDLLKQASDAMDRWLSLVSPEDLKEALNIVSTEERYKT